MAFNIKSDETHELARELSERTGESMSKAVDAALREKLARLERAGMADRAMRIVKDAAKYVPPGASSTGDVDELYDELGLPK
jgi:antitoxin VapB